MNNSRITATRLILLNATVYLLIVFTLILLLEFVLRVG